MGAHEQLNEQFSTPTHFHLNRLNGKMFWRSFHKNFRFECESLAGRFAFFSSHSRSFDVQDGGDGKKEFCLVSDAFSGALKPIK